MDTLHICSSPLRRVLIIALLITAQTTTRLSYGQPESSGNALHNELNRATDRRWNITNATSIHSMHVEATASDAAANEDDVVYEYVYDEEEENDDDDDENDDDNGDDNGDNNNELDPGENRVEDVDDDVNNKNDTNNATLDELDIAANSFKAEGGDDSGVVTSSYSLTRLRQSLLAYYDKSSRPVRNSLQPIVVQVNINLAQINNLDEVYQLMTSTLQVSVHWRDEFIRWNESRYGNAISFQSHEVWVPDIVALNNVNNFKFENKETYLIGYANSIFEFSERNKYFVMVRPSGQCRWVFPIKLMTICQLNQVYFPFDMQQCSIELASSAYPTEQLQLRMFKNRLGAELTLQNEGEFDLDRSRVDELETPKSKFGPACLNRGVVGSSNDTIAPQLQSNLSYANWSSLEDNAICDAINFSTLRITVFMRRKIIFSFNKIILPYFVFYIVTIFTYLLPVESGEKKSYITSILISGLMYLKDISYYIPKTSLLPILSIYFNLNFIYVFVCLIFSTIIYSVYYLDKTKRPLPGCLKRIVQRSNFVRYDQMLKDAFWGIKSSLHTLAYKRNYARIKLEIRNELKVVNTELSSVVNQSKLMTTNVMLLEHQLVNNCENNVVPTPASHKHRSERRVLDLLGHETLQMFRTLKALIRKHNRYREVNDDYNASLNVMFSFCTGLNEAPLRVSHENDPIFYDERSMSNFRYINTLEDLKIEMIRPSSAKRARKKRRQHRERSGDSSALDYHTDDSTQQQRGLYHNPHHCHPKQQHKQQKFNLIVPTSSPSSFLIKSNNHELKRARHFLFLLKNYKSQINAYLYRFGGARRQRQQQCGVDGVWSTSSVTTADMRRKKPACVVTLFEAYQWKYLAIMLDRLVFYFFAFIMPISIVTMTLMATLFHH